MKNLVNMAPATMDMWIYILIAFFGAWSVAFGTDDAAKFIQPSVLFWLKACCASASGSFLAAKMYRSTAFAEHQKEKKQKEETQFLSKTTV